MPKIPNYGTPMFDASGNMSLVWWRYLSAIGSSGSGNITTYTQADYATAYSNGLGTDPLFIFVSDFAHWIYWDGAAAQFADGGNDYYALGQFSGAPVGWHLADGSTVNILNVNGTLTSKTLSNVEAQKTALAVQNAADTLSGPSGATFTGTPDSLYGPITSAFNGTPAPASGVVTSIFTGSAETFTTGIVSSGTGATVLESPTSVTPVGTVASSFNYTPVGLVSSTLTAIPYTPGGTVNSGFPENFTSRLWYRL